MARRLRDLPADFRACDNHHILYPIIFVSFYSKKLGDILAVTNNNFEYLRYDYLLCFNVYVTGLLLLPLFCDLEYLRYSG